MTGRLAIRDKRRVARRIQLLRKVILKMCRGCCGGLLRRLDLLCGLLLLSAAGALLRPICARYARRLLSNAAWSRPEGAR